MSHKTTFHEGIMEIDQIQNDDIITAYDAWETAHKGHDVHDLLSQMSTHELQQLGELVDQARSAGVNIPKGLEL